MVNKTFAQEKIVKDNKNEFTSGNARSESCYPCVNGEYWKQAKRSVVRILVFNEGNTMMCTGVLINNTGMDAKPYVLTAHHCISNQAEADRAIFTFNHDDVNCDGNLPASATSLFGGVLRAHSYEHDFALIELNDHVPLGFHPYFSGWNISHAQFGQVSCIHHPLAEPKKVSVQNQQIVTSDFVVEGKPNRAANAFWHVKDWDVGYTERGSSGAPLFNKQQQVIGTLSGGESSCSNPHDDFFARLSESWEASADSAAQLKCWLDPNSTGKKTLEGFDPLAGRDVVCDTFSNIIRDESIGIIPYEPGTGYFTGCNSGNVSAFAESFIVEDSSFLTGINISIGSLSQASQGGIHVSVHADGGGVPGELLFEKFLPYSTLHLYRNYIELYPFVTVSGRFFVSYSPSCSVGDEFAVEQAYWRSSSVNTMFVKNATGWAQINKVHPQLRGTSLAIEAIVCSDPDVTDPPVTDIQFRLYPNPSESMLICVVDSNDESEFRPYVYDSKGQVQNAAVTQFNKEFFIDVSSLRRGVYIFRLQSSSSSVYRRFIKI